MPEVDVIQPDIRLLSDTEAVVLRGFIAKPVLPQHAAGIRAWLEELDIDPLPAEPEIVKCLLTFVKEGLIVRHKERKPASGRLPLKYFVLADEAQARRLLRHKRLHILRLLSFIDP